MPLICPWVVLPFLAYIAFFTPSVGPVWLSVLLKVLVAAVVVCHSYAMLSTKYRVEDGILHVRMGPFKRSVAIDSITSITDHGTPKGRLYGLGTDIIGITYEGGSVDITPKDVDGFMAAIGFRFAGSEDTEAPASLRGS